MTHYHLWNYSVAIVSFSGCLFFWWFVTSHNLYS